MRKKLAIAIIALAGLSLGTLEASNHNCPGNGQGKESDRHTCTGRFEPIWMNVVTCATSGFPHGIITLLPTSPLLSQKTDPLRVAWVIDTPKEYRKWTLSWKDEVGSVNAFPGNKVIVNPTVNGKSAFFSKRPTNSGDFRVYKYKILVEEKPGGVGPWKFCAELDPEIRVKDDGDDDEPGRDSDEDEEGGS